MSASLYTGKVRAYMRLNNIDFGERGAGHPEFTKTIIPAVGRWIIPVVVTPGGEILQDGTDILDTFEARGFSQHSLYPDDAVMRAISYVFELFGGEGLLRHAMHYRWNFDAENLAFIKHNFAEAFPEGLTVKQQSAAFDQSSGRMRMAGAAFGVTPDTFEAIETSYAEVLNLLQAHFKTTYYLLGGHPTLGDYGLFNGLYAHLSRDPRPSMIMKTTAPRVFTWTERMNRSESRDEHALKGASKALFKTPPETLKNLMRFIAVDYLPELRAHISHANQWLDARPDIATMTNGLKSPSERSIGFAEFMWRGLLLKTAVLPYRFYLLQRLQDHYDQSPQADKAAIRSVFDKTNLLDILDLRTQRRVERLNYMEVWR